MRAGKKQEEEANKPWYEKTWDAVSTFTGEVSGYYDYRRAAEGVDPVTGEKLSTSQRVAAGAMAAAGFIPVVGWVGRAAKGGKAIYKTAKGLSAADHALDAYKSAKSFKVLQQTEKGLYGLVAANGLGEYMTGRDMFGNKISEEQRKASLLQALGIAGAGALSTKVAGKMGQSLATKGTEKLNNMRNTLRTSAVANVTKQAYQSVKNAPASWTQSLHKTYNNILDSSMPRLMPDLVPAGPALAQQTVRETLQNVKKQTMQMIEKPVKVERVSERQIQTGTKGTGEEIKPLGNVQRISEIEVKFKYKTKFDSEEFARQLKDQEQGMNELTVHEYQQNRKRFIEEGRAKESNAAQQAAREKALNKKIEELFESGLSWDEAEKQASRWLKTKAALHNPDQVAGGKPLDIGGMGDKRINFSIGSQWKSRIKIVDEGIEEMAKDMTPEQLKNTYLNVKLTH
ncbi:polymorphic toxin type 15 domain-containing protein [Priestia megaterium]